MAVCVWMFMYSATPCSHSSRVIKSQVTCSTWLNHVWWNYWHVEYTVYNREIWLMRLLSACLHLSLLIRAGLICRIFNIDTSSKIQRNVVTNVDTTSWILLMFVSLCLVGVWKDASFFFFVLPVAHAAPCAAWWAFGQGAAEKEKPRADNHNLPSARITVSDRPRTCQVTSSYSWCPVVGPYKAAVSSPHLWNMPPRETWYRGVAMCKARATRRLLVVVWWIQHDIKNK